MATLTNRAVENVYQGFLNVDNNPNGVDATLRVVQDGVGNATPLYLSQTKVKIKPSSNSTDMYEIQDISGNVILQIDTTNKKIIAPSGSKFSGDGSLLTGITGATGGVSNTGSTNIVADSDANGSGDITFTIGSTELAKILNDGSGTGGIFSLPNKSTLPTPEANTVGYGAQNDRLVQVTSDGSVKPLSNTVDVSAPAGGYILDGTDDYIEVADNDNLDLGTGDFTLETYIKTGSDITTSQAILAKRALGYGDGFNTMINSSDLYFKKISS